jgi:hypothetical protein
MASLMIELKDLQKRSKRSRVYVLHIKYRFIESASAQAAEKRIPPPFATMLDPVLKIDQREFSVFDFRQALILHSQARPGHSLLLCRTQSSSTSPGTSVPRLDSSSGPKSAQTSPSKLKLTSVRGDLPLPVNTWA